MAKINPNACSAVRSTSWAQRDLPGISWQRLQQSQFCWVTIRSEAKVAPYDWWSPHRTLQMFEVLSRAIPYSGPLFVFAHIVKPHLPATFDQFGNQVTGQSVYDSLDDSHDPSVPDAYTGQLIYINSLVLRAVDGILDHSDGQAIIVIAADHGRSVQGGRRDHDILAAFHLPNDGGRGLYPSISSVNHFRYILDRYFGFDIGLIEDRKVWHQVGDLEFTDVAGDVKG